MPPQCHIYATYANCFMSIYEHNYVSICTSYTQCAFIGTYANKHATSKVALINDVARIALHRL